MYIKKGILHEKQEGNLARKSLEEQCEEKDKQNAAKSNGWHARSRSWTRVRREHIEHIEDSKWRICTTKAKLHIGNEEKMSCIQKAMVSKITYPRQRKLVATSYWDCKSIAAWHRDSCQDRHPISWQTTRTTIKWAEMSNCEARRAAARAAHMQSWSSESRGWRGDTTTLTCPTFVSKIGTQEKVAVSPRLTASSPGQQANQQTRKNQIKQEQSAEKLCEIRQMHTAKPRRRDALQHHNNS